MTNPTYRARLLNDIAYAIREARAASTLGHPGLIGRVRELATEKLIHPMLPAGYEVGTGKVCDQNGAVSSEIDLIIHNPSVLPPLMYSGRDGLFPIEASLYGIEVKSVVTSREIADAVRKAESIISLEWKAKASQPRRHLSPTISCLFGFSSDLRSGADDFERYKEFDPTWPTDPILKAICIVGSGYWYHDPGEGHWWFHASDEGCDEVIDFIAGLANTLIQQRYVSRDASLGRYLMAERLVRKLPR